MDIISHATKNERIVDLSIKIDQTIYSFGVENIFRTKKEKEFVFKGEKIEKLFTEIKFEFEKSHLSMVKDYSNIDIYEKIVSPIIERYISSSRSCHHH